MALMQIAEPGQSPDPHQQPIVAGIDLGTTHSLVAMERAGQSQCLPDENKNTLLPSMVTYDVNGLITVGGESRNGAIQSIKRFIGRSSKEVAQLLERFPTDFQWDLSNPKVPKVITAQGPRSVIEISAEILKPLRQRMLAFVGEEQVNPDGPSLDVVVTVPAYFDDSQRQATRSAAELAGLNVLRLINEPTAAVLAYQIETDGQFLVYDFGGGTFDASLINKQGDTYEVLATAGDTFLGGDDIDRLLVEAFLARYRNNLPKNMFAQKGQALVPEKAAQLLSELKAAKERLSVQTEVTVSGQSVTRAFLEEVAAPIIAKTMQCVQSLLTDATKEHQVKVQRILLVGGATQSPMVHHALEASLAITPEQGVNPNEVVALGALAQARKVSGEQLSHLLLDVCPLSLGIETMGGLVEPIITRNTPIPVSKEQEYTTGKNGQTALLLHILQGEREQVEHCRSLARFELRDIPALPAGVARIRVRFALDANSLLTVSATEARTGHNASVTVNPSQGLDQDQLLQMIQQSQTAGTEDIVQRLEQNTRIDGMRLIQACEHALNVDAQLLNTAELNQYQKALTELRHATDQDLAVLEQAIVTMKQVSEPLAARRMDNAIRAALAGTYVNEYE